MSVVDNLNEIKACKQDIRQAIADKGVDMTNVPLSGYAEKIAEIEPPIFVKIYEYFIGDWKVVGVRNNRIMKVKRGDTVTLPEGVDVAVYNQDSLSNPLMTFCGYDSPIDIVDNTITIPMDWSGDVDIYCNYTFANNCYVVRAATALQTGTSTTTTAQSRTYRKDWSGMPTTGNIRFQLTPIILDGNFQMSAGIQFLMGYRGVTDLVLPMSIGFIGTQEGAGNYYSTCYMATELKRVHLPNNLTEIGHWAFNYCYSLNDINMPSHLERIGDRAFNMCRSLMRVTFPASLTYIGEGVFMNCVNLRDLHFKNSVPPVLENSNAIYQHTKMYVPDDAVDAYKAAPVWSEIADRIFPESSFDLK